MLLDTVTVSQKAVPGDFVEEETEWTYLGSTVQISSGTLVVELSDAGDGTVVADAIRIEKTGTKGLWFGESSSSNIRTVEMSDVGSQENDGIHVTKVLPWPAPGLKYPGFAWRICSEIFDLRCRHSKARAVSITDGLTDQLKEVPW